MTEASASTPAHVGVILNPRAARGKAIQLLPQLADQLIALGVTCAIHVTSAPKEAMDVARQFANSGTDRVIAVGGDGIVNEVVNGLLNADRQVGLGIIPASRGSDFARSLQTPRDVRTALTRAVQQPLRPIDAAQVRFADGRERYYVNIAGVGFDAVVAVRANRSRVPGSTLPYLAAIGAALTNFRNAEVTIETNGRQRRQRVWAVLVANGSYFGGGMRIVPAASIDDGQLDLAVLGDVTKPDLLRTLPKVFSGRHVGHPKFHTEPLVETRITSAHPLLVELDGEVVGETPATFSIVPASLLVAG